MRICFIDWFAYGLFNPKSKIVFGGAQIQLYFLANALAKDKNHKVYFLADNGRTNRVQSFFNVIVYQFVRSPKTPGIFGRLLNLLYIIQALGYIHFFLRLLIQLRKINAEIYVQRAASAETGLIAIICKILRCKFIFMVAHEQDINGTFIRQNGWQGKLFLLGLSLADKIICQTKDQQNLLTGRFKDKSTVIFSGYPLKPLRKIRGKRIDVLWVARAEQWKQPELFIKLAKKFPMEKFTMICPPAENNPRYFQMIKNQAQKIKNINFIKYVPFGKIDAYFRAAKVFISTSESEGFPNTFLQAGGNSSTILSYKVNPDRMINQYHLGLWANGDQELLAKQLGQLLASQKLRLHLARNLYDYIVNHHNLRKTAGKFQRLLTEV